MPAESRYFPEQHLLYERMYGATSPEEVGERQAHHVEFLATVDEPINILIDFRAMQWEPTTMRTMRENMKPMDSPMLRWIVFIIPKDSTVQPFSVSVNTQIATKGSRLEITHSLEEALSFLETRDDSLDFSGLRSEIEQITSPNA